MLPATVLEPRSTVRPSSQRPECGVRIEDVGSIRRVIIDRPSKKNAITRSMYDALTDAFTEARSRFQTDVVVLTSSGGAFSVGTDFADFSQGEPVDSESEEFIRATSRFFRTLVSFPKPIVAAVGGLALGAGATLLLHCDLVVAARTAAFQFPYVKLGIAPDAGSSVLLSARVGLTRATEWLLSGDRIDVDTALAHGFVTAIVYREELDATAMARAEAIAKLPQEGVREMKRLLRQPLRAAVDEAMARESTSSVAHLPLPGAAVPTSSGFFSRR